MKGTSIAMSGFRSVLGVVLLLGVGFAPPPGVEAQESRYGLSIYGSMLQPMGPLKGWYNISPTFIGQLTYVVSDRTMTEVEVHYTMLPDAGLSSREFVWHNQLREQQTPPDKVKSPNAKADMWIASLLVNGMRTFKPDEAGQTIPYIVAGIGFYKYNHDVSGLIFPGQVGHQIDAQSMLEPTQDTDVALSINTGLGFYHRTSERFLIDFRLRWNVLMGELRPYEDWGLKKAFPIQCLNLMVGFKYFLN